MTPPQVNELDRSTTNVHPSGELASNDGTMADDSSTCDTRTAPISRSGSSS